MNTLRFRLLSVTAVTWLALALVAPAVAAEPDIDFFHDEGSFVVADCGSFLALADYVADYTVTTLFDAAGHPVRVQAQYLVNATLTNSVTGVSLSDHSHWMLFWDLEQGTTSDVGLVYQITIPGEGIVVLDAGRIVWDANDNVIFEAGQHQVLHEGGAVFCGALS